MASAETNFTQDREVHGRKLDLAQCMRIARETTGKSFASQVGEIIRLSRCDGKLTPQDYYYFGLYDDEKFTFDDKRRFISERAFPKVIYQCSDLRWWATADNKLIAYTLLESFGAPVPETQAVFIGTARNFGRIPTFSEAAGLTRFLTEEARYPLFAKPLEGVCSWGATLIDSHEDGNLHLHGGETLSMDEFISRLDADQGYMFQTVLRPHSVLAQFADVISTVRVIVIINDGQPEVLHSLLKIPGSGNVADNFWRDGNMLAALNNETGVVEKAIRGYGPYREDLIDHPETGAKLIGTQLPGWGAIIELCLNCATIFSPIRYQSFDIAICPDGPVVVEVNTGSAFNLAQLVKNEGFLSDRYRDFLTDCGYKLKD